MKIPFYIVNAFDKKPFSGNPTGVCILEEWLSTDDLQQIASQNGISETTFCFLQGPIYGRFAGFPLLLRKRLVVMEQWQRHTFCLLKAFQIQID